MAKPLNQGRNLPVNNAFPRTNAFIQHIEAQAAENVAFGQLLQALHKLNTTITNNQAADIDEEVLVGQFAAAITETMILTPLISANKYVLAANVAFQREVGAFIQEVHLIKNPQQNDPSIMVATVAGGVLLTAGTVAVGPALALGVLRVAGFSAIGPVAGSLAASIQSAVYGGAVTSGSLFAICQSAAMGGITVGAAQVAAGLTALGAGAGLWGARGDR
ncbi:hypothetical protein FRC01_008479 [Tulasnella sp. 417]|nr:hypothetical protein FRC01_008479 [Tulasnella sp. 417]